MPLWSALTAAYRQHIYLAGRQPLFLLLVAFVLGFAFIRAVRPGCACRQLAATAAVVGAHHLFRFQQLRGGRSTG